MQLTLPWRNIGPVARELFQRLSISMLFSGGGSLVRMRRQAIGESGDQTRASTDSISEAKRAGEHIV